MAESKRKKVVKKVSTTKKSSTKKSTGVKKVNVKKVNMASVNSVGPEVYTSNQDHNAYKYTVYFVGILIGLWVIIAGICDIYKNVTTDNLNNSYLVETNVIKSDNVLSLDDAKTKFNGLSGDYFIYISYQNSNDIYKLEKKLASVIKSYNLTDKFYYIDVKNIKDDDNYIQELNALLGYRDVLVKNVPTIIYVDSKNIIQYQNIITRTDNKMMNIGDFQQLLDINGF